MNTIKERWAIYRRLVARIPTIHRELTRHRINVACFPDQGRRVARLRFLRSR